MQQIYEVKEITLTRGGLADREICSNNELQEVSRGHSTGEKIFLFRKGPNNHKFRVRD